MWNVENQFVEKTLGLKYWKPKYSFGNHSENEKKNLMGFVDSV